jgi:transposase
MLYLGIDQHRKQLTVNLRDEEGRVLIARQASTEWKRVRAFCEQVRQQAQGAGGFRAILEVCGFNDWLVKMLRDEFGCADVVLVQPTSRNRKKTDRRDAAKLAELLWINRQCLERGERPRGLRRVVLPTPEDAENRQLTAFRNRLGQCRTKTLNKIQLILMRHNLQQECPTRTRHSQAARRWLQQLELPEIDRFEMNQLLEQWTLWDKQLAEVEKKIVERHAEHADAPLLATIPGARDYTALGLGSRIGNIDRFPRSSSLPNYWGIIPGCRNSGEATQRLGSITKEGSALARFLLGQLVLHVLRKDRPMKEWYLRIKRRRGAKIARVAVMRRLATIIWHMLHDRRTYQQVRVQETARRIPRGVAGTFEESPKRRLAADEKRTAKRAKKKQSVNV